MKNPMIGVFEKKAHAGVKPLPKFRPGDTVRVVYKIAEDADMKKFRLQPFEGVVLSKHGGTAGGSFTVRKISAGGIGVERNFPNVSPYIEKVEILASGIVRRAKLHYIRKLSGKSARIRNQYAAGGQVASDGMGSESATAAPATEESKA